MNKSKRNYMDFLNADTSLSFAEYVGIEIPQIDISLNGEYRFRSSKATGEYKKTKKEARENYKQALCQSRAVKKLLENETMNTGKQRFELKRGHIDLAKRLNISWDAGCYEGAPVVDEKRPYGNSDALQDIAEILGLEFIEEGDERYLDEQTKKICRNWHREMSTAIKVILSTQCFVPGIYEKPQYGYNNWEQIYISGI